MKQSVLCYPERDGRYLMLYRNRKKNDENAGKWIGVGGQLEEGESPDDCLLREVREETGLTLTAYRFRGIVTFVSDRYGTEQMYLFTADGLIGTEIACNEGELAWIEKDKVLSLPLWEGDRLFLNLLAEEASVFLLKLVYEGDTLVRAVLDGRPLSL